LQTQTPNPRRVAAGKKRWEQKSDQEKQAHASKMLEARWGKREPENGIGESVADGVDGSAEERALNDAKHALSRKLWGPDVDLVHAIRAVQSAILRGEVEAVVEDAKLAFYVVTRERVA
jgi:hypothetical protein